MTAAPFLYKKARSVDDAVQLLAQHPDAKILAGGHSLIPAMKLRLNQPSLLIDIRNLSELREIREEEDVFVIGATVTHDEIARHTGLAASIPMVCQAAGKIGDVQVRNMGTIGGSVVHADPSADWPAVLLACRAVFVAKGPDGLRQIAASQFFQGFFSTALEEAEIVTQIRIPKPALGSKSVYMKFEQPASRFAIVGCAAMMDGGKVSLAFTGVADAPFRDMELEKEINMNGLNAANIVAAAAKAADGVSVLSDHYASEEYRLHLARVYAKRALMALL